MPRFALVLLLAALPLMALACDGARPEAPSADVPAQVAASGRTGAAGPLQPIALHVPDISCALCARPIERNLQAIGVRDVKVDLETKWVTGRFDPELLTPEAIRAKVEDLRFRVSGLRVREGIEEPR